MISRTWVAAAAAASASLMVGPAAEAAAEPRVHTIVMTAMRFGPVPAGIRTGDIIVWVNRDMVPHTATVSGIFDVDVPARQSRRMRVTRAGSFAFYCRYHPTMRSSFSATR